MSNAKYEGTWANGLQDGYGSETYADGGQYWIFIIVFPKGPFLYYVSVFWGFFELPTHLGKDIFST